MKRSKGFTLIELITTIAILGLVIVLAMPVLNNVSGRTLAKTYQNKVKYIELAGGNFASELVNEIKSAAGTVCIDIETLIKEGYLISDEKNKLLLTNPNQTATNNSQGEVGKYMSGVIEMYYQNDDVMIEYTTNSTTCSTMVEIPDEEDLRYIVDLVPPTGTFSINQGDFTNSRDLTLTLNPNDDAYYFCYSNTNSGCTVYHKLSDYNLNSVSYRLPESYDGTHNIYLWYRDKHYNTMETAAHDSIVYDATKPTGSILINSGNTYTNTTSVTLGINANDATSGLEAYCVSNSNTCTNWVSITPNKNLSININWTLDLVQGSRRVSVWFRDRSKNISIQNYDDIFLDTVKPTIGTISINNNATYTTSRNVNLKLSSTDAAPASGLSYMCISLSSTCVTWKLYSTDSTITLANAQGNQSVYIKYMDHAGNISNQNSDSIYLDTIDPTCTNRGDSTTWTKEDRIIYYGCRDNESGCSTASTTEKSKTFSETTKLGTIGAYTITDKAGNSKNCPARTANVYVDKTDPKCTDAGDSTNWTKNNRTIYYGCSDDHSGCNVSFSGGNIEYKTTTKTAEIEKYTIKDNVGNEKECLARTADVYVDKTAPTCSISFTACGASGTGTCTDSDSKIKTGASVSITAGTTMSHSCEDNAGMTSTCSITKTYDTCCSGTTTCVSGNKTCPTSACGCSEYNSTGTETYPTSCTEETTNDQYTTCSVNSWKCNCGASCYSGSESWTATGNRCTDACVSATPSGSNGCKYITGTENGVNKYKKTVYSCKTYKSCQHADCGVDPCLTTTSTCVAGYK